MATETCPWCAGTSYAVDDEVTDEPFRAIVSDVKLVRVRCSKCPPAGARPARTAILFLARSGRHELVRRMDLAHIVRAASLIRPATSADHARATAIALVALVRHHASREVLAAARASVARCAAGGWSVSLRDLGDSLTFGFDECGKLVATSSDDG